MKLNTDKCHVVLNSQWPKIIKIENLCIESSSCEKMLGINFDYKLKFANHIEEICKKASQKLNALARIAPYVVIRKRRTLMNALFKWQFNYCLLIWICCNRSSDNKIDRLHERSLRIVNSNKTSDLSELLEIDGSVSIHYQNVRQLVQGIKRFVSWNCERIVLM